MNQSASAGDPARCPHRKILRREPAGEIARCDLLPRFTGVADPELCEVRADACRACQRSFAPSLTEINPVIASLLFQLSRTVIERGGQPGCDVEKASQMKEFARRHLRIARPPGAPGTRQPARKGSCFYLGEPTGEKPCATCRGSVRLKVYECRHERHGETTRPECLRCADFEPQLAAATVKTWAVGMIAAPRLPPTLSPSLASLRQAGWEQAHLFAEAGAEIPARLSGVIVTRRPQPLGAWPSWLLSLSELALLNPDADAYLLCQDDVAFAPDLRGYLESRLWPAPRVGVVSLSCPSHARPADRAGFYADEKGWGTWSALAFVFPNAAAHALLRHHSTFQNRRFGSPVGKRPPDTVIAQWCREARLPFFTHSPGLAQIIGRDDPAMVHWRTAADSANTVAIRDAAARPVKTVDPVIVSRLEAAPPRPVRVGYLYPWLHIGGVTRTVITLGRHYDPRQVQFVGLAIANPGGTSDPRACERIQHMPLYSGPVPGAGWHDQATIQRLSSYEEAVHRVASQADVLVVWGLQGAPRQKVQQILASYPCQVILVSHGCNEWTRSLMQQNEPMATHFAAVSQAAVESFSPEIRPRVRVIYNGTDLTRCTPTLSRAEQRRQWGFGESDLLIGYLGRFSPEKNPAAAARAAVHLSTCSRRRAGRPQVAAVYVGTGWKEAETRAEVQAIAGDRARFFPPLEQVGDFYHAVDAVICASHTEAGPQVLTEAWLCRVPIVMTPVGLIREFDEPMAAMVPLDPTPEQLAEAVRYALSPAYRPVIERAWQVAWERFTGAHTTDGWTRLFREAAGREGEQAGR